MIEFFLFSIHLSTLLSFFTDFNPRASKHTSLETSLLFHSPALILKNLKKIYIYRH